MWAAVQVAFVLSELTNLSSMTVSAVMALCRGQAPSAPGQLDCMSSFLVASLDHMTASVSLMHGRLPLNESDEALQEIAQCALDLVVQVAACCAPMHAVILKGLQTFNILTRLLSLWMVCGLQSCAHQLRGRCAVPQRCA